MKIYYTLSIPNKEVRVTYTGIVDRYFSTKIENEKLETMLKALNFSGSFFIVFLL